MLLRKGVLLTAVLSAQSAFAQTPMEKFEFVNFSRVNITDRFLETQNGSGGDGNPEGLHLPDRNRYSPYQKF